MRVCVVGLGYIGLPTALMLASHGVEVGAIDCNAEIVEKLRNGQLSFSEKGFSLRVVGVFGSTYGETYSTNDYEKVGFKLVLGTKEKR